MKEIIYDGKVIAKYISNNEESDDLNFYSNDVDFLQVGTWKYNKGKILQKHIHNSVERIVNRTHEVLYVKNGMIKASIYSFSETLVEEVVLKKGDALILLDCGHGYEILEDNTKVLEIKNGPYLGADIDRRRF